MRGRLIQKFVAELGRIDTSAIEAAGNFDDAFREATSIDTDGDGVGDPTRQEMTAIQIPCQIESEVWEALSAHVMGADPDFDIRLVFHFRDLESLGLVGSDGNATITIGDRLIRILDKAGTTEIQQVPAERPLYVTEALPRGWGICMANPTRNLLVVTFAARGLGGG
jgi:hypothetical protein